MNASTEFKMSADTPLVSRSPHVDAGKAIVIAGSRFEDGRRRVIVSQGVSDEDAQNITTVMTEAEVERARLTERIAIVRRMLGPLS